MQRAQIYRKTNNFGLQHFQVATVGNADGVDWVASLLDKYSDRGCKGAAEWWPLGVQGAVGRWAGAVCGWGADPGMSSGGRSKGGWGLGDHDGGGAADWPPGRSPGGSPWGPPWGGAAGPTGGPSRVAGAGGAVTGMGGGWVVDFSKSEDPELFVKPFNWRFKPRGQLIKKYYFFFKQGVNKDGATGGNQGTCGSITTTRTHDRC